MKMDYASRLDLVNGNKRKFYQIVAFHIQVDFKEFKENEKLETCLDLDKDLKKLWIMPVTFIPMNIGAFGTFPKNLGKKLESLDIRARSEIIHTIALLNHQ